MVLVGLTAIALYGWAYGLLQNKNYVLLVVFTWVVNPKIAYITTEARHYDLLALVTALFAWQITRTVAGQRPWLLLMVTTAAGILTHYHFVLVIAAGGLVLFIFFITQDRKHLFRSYAAMGGGGLLFAILHPQFLNGVTYWPSPSYDPVYKFERILDTYDTFWYFIPLIFVVGAWVYHHKKIPLTASKWSIIWLWGVTAVAMLGLYWFALSPGHAMSVKYVAMGWVFWAFIPAFVLELGHGFMQRYLVVYCYALPLCIAGYMIFSVAGQTTPQLNAIHNIPNQADVHIVVDAPNRLIWSPLFFHLPDSVQVYAAPQLELTANPEPWLSVLDTGDFYLGHVFWGNSWPGTNLDVSWVNSEPGLQTNVAFLCQRYDTVVHNAWTGHPGWHMFEINAQAQSGYQAQVCDIEE